MARKSNNESAISLFSFQDIITSITGIMFLVVLLLMLMIITSRIPTAADIKADENAKELQQELTELKSKLQTLRKSQKELDKAIDHLKKLSPEEILRQKQELRQTLQAEQLKLEALDSEIKNKENQYRQILQKYQALLQSFEQRQQVISQLQKQLKETTETIKEKEETQRQRRRVMKYVVHNSSVKRPFLAELDKDGIRFMDPESKKLTDLRRPGKAHESLPMFAMELSKLDPVQIYFSIAVKPGGFQYALKLLEILKNNKFERGTEILPNDETSIFEEKTP